MQGNDGLQILAKALLAQKAEERPTATKALVLGAFAPVPPGRDPNTDRRQCQICFDDFWADEGIACTSEHFHCNECLSGFCDMFNGLSLAEVARRGALGCGVYECGARHWSPTELARSLPGEIIHFVVCVRLKIIHRFFFLCRRKISSLFEQIESSSRKQVDQRTRTTAQGRQSESVATTRAIDQRPAGCRSGFGHVRQPYSREHPQFALSALSSCL